MDLCEKKLSSEVQKCCLPIKLGQDIKILSKICHHLGFIVFMYHARKMPGPRLELIKGFYPKGV